MTHFPTFVGPGGEGDFRRLFVTGSALADVKGVDMRVAFSLLDQSWIPVRLANGGVEEVSLMDALENAREFHAVEHQDPLVAISVFRLLLAFVHRALDGPGSVDDAAQWCENGFPGEALTTYANQWSEHFDLFHPERPFLQHPGITNPRFQDPWTCLQAATSAKNTNFLFRESLRGLESPVAGISAAEAARLLVGHQTFALGGLIRRLRTSIQAAPNARGALTVVNGANLLETLCLNLVPHPKGVPTRWEEGPADFADLEEAVASPIEAACQSYAWPARAILLNPDSDGWVLSVGYAAGRAHIEGFVDPMQAMVPGFQDQIAPLRHSSRREMWTQISALVPAPAGGHPAVIEHARGLLSHMGRPAAQLSVDVVGLDCHKAKILDVRNERLVISLEFAREQVGSWLDSARQRLDSFLEALEIVFCSLGHDQESAKARIASLGVERLYWSGLKPKFEDFLTKAGALAPEERGRAWWVIVCRQMEKSFENIAGSLGGSAKTLLGIELARRHLGMRPGRAPAPSAHSLAFVGARWSGTMLSSHATAAVALVARLMPRGGLSGRRTSLAIVLGGIVKDASVASGCQSPVERRLLLALDLPQDEALVEVERLARLAMRGVYLDWSRLLDDLENWERAGREVQRRWVREFLAGKTSLIRPPRRHPAQPSAAFPPPTKAPPELGESLPLP